MGDAMIDLNDMFNIDRLPAVEKVVVRDDVQWAFTTSEIMNGLLATGISPVELSATWFPNRPVPCVEFRVRGDLKYKVIKVKGEQL